MFLRFVVGTDAEHHRHLTGVIVCARLLRDDGLLEPYEVDLVEAVFTWFNEHVPCPPFATAGWSREAVCWFKDDADEPIRRVRDLVVVLESHGQPVRMLRTSRPGRVLYEDAVQVVVEEWKELARS
jgi:hypothetical protein